MGLYYDSILSLFVGMLIFSGKNMKKNEIISVI